MTTRLYFNSVQELLSAKIDMYGIRLTPLSVVISTPSTTLDNRALIGQSHRIIYVRLYNVFLITHNLATNMVPYILLIVLYRCNWEAMWCLRGIGYWYFWFV